MDGYGIKSLTRTHIPDTHIIMSVESRLGGDKAGYEQRWRCGAVQVVRHKKGFLETEEALAFEDIDAMWDIICAKANRRGVTFLWCHDLSWTARVSAAFIQLPQRDWKLTAFNLVPGSGWLVWRKGRCTLKFFDTMSIWQTGMDGLAKLFEMGRKPLPAVDARPETWMSRVWADRAIMLAAVRNYLSWVVTNDLGPLAVTGTGQAWSAFRRRFLTHGILVHSDIPLRAMEREAMWAGRAEAYWHGAILTQQVDEWDFTSAHNNIARTELVPVYPTRPVGQGADVSSLAYLPGLELLADVEVNTPQPVVPLRTGNGIVWATGEFRTTLWGPELRELLRAGASVHLRNGHLYKSAPALHAWGSWISAHLSGGGNDIPAWIKAIIKRWGNTLVGRFGMRYPEWENIGWSPRSDAFAIPLWDVDTDEEHLLMQAGHELFEQVGVSDPRYCAPMVTGYIMSSLRAKLWRLMSAMPPMSLLYVDTDSVLTTDAWRPHMRAISRSPDFEGLRLKRTWDGFAIYGPRQIITGNEVRFSGLPKTATRVGRHDFEGEVTESLGQALGANALDRVRISRKRWTVEGRDVRRNGPAVGWTEPLHVEMLGGNDVS